MSRNKKFDKIDGGVAVPALNWERKPRGLRAVPLREAGVVSDRPMPAEWKKLADELPGAPKSVVRVQESGIERVDKKYGIKDRCAHLPVELFYNLLLNYGNNKPLLDRVDRFEITGALSGTFEFIPSKGKTKLDSIPPDVEFCDPVHIRRYGLSAAMREQSQIGVVGQQKVYGLLRLLQPTEERVPILAHPLPSKREKQEKEIKKFDPRRMPTDFSEVTKNLKKLKRVAATLEDMPDGHTVYRSVWFCDQAKKTGWGDTPPKDTVYRPVAQAYHPSYAEALRTEFKRVAFLDPTDFNPYETVYATHESREKAENPNLLFPDGKPIILFDSNQPVIILTPPDYRPPASGQSPDPAGG